MSTTCSYNFLQQAHLNKQWVPTSHTNHAFSSSHSFYACIYFSMIFSVYFWRMWMVRCLWWISLHTVLQGFTLVWIYITVLIHCDNKPNAKDYRFVLCGIVIVIMCIHIGWWQYLAEICHDWTSLLLEYFCLAYNL